MAKDAERRRDAVTHSVGRVPRYNHQLKSKSMTWQSWICTKLVRPWIYIRLVRTFSWISYSETLFSWQHSVAKTVNKIFCPTKFICLAKTIYLLREVPEFYFPHKKFRVNTKSLYFVGVPQSWYRIF